MRTATVFVSRRQLSRLKGRVTRVVEPYDSFVLVEATDEQLEALQASGYKVVPREDLDRIDLGAITIDTREPRYTHRGEVRPHSAYPHVEAPGPGPHHYIVQFIGPVKEEWKEEITAWGGVLCDPLPSYSYVVEMDEATLQRVLQAAFVRWVGHYDPNIRISPELQRPVSPASSLTRGPAMDMEPSERSQPSTAPRGPADRRPTGDEEAPGMDAGEGEGPGLPLRGRLARPLPSAFAVSFHTRQSLEDAIPQIEALDGTVAEGREGQGRTLTVTFRLDVPAEEMARRLAGIHGVKFVEAVTLRQLRNDVATRLMLNPDAGGDDDLPFELPWTGRREVVAITDTGLDTGDPATLHPDFRGRIVNLTSWATSPAFDDLVLNPRADDGPADLDSGHGTHVTGSALGDGTRSLEKGLRPIRGLAHQARLVFQAVEHRLEWKPEFITEYRRRYGEDPPPYHLAGLPGDLVQLFQAAYDLGARVHSNSWGGGEFGAYDRDAAAVDQFVWEHKDAVILFAAGNDGADLNRDGQVDPGSVTPPGTAKNCITVGASESLRPQFGYRYGLVWGSAFPRSPLHSDLLADDPTDVAAFSSRGPCTDGRVKPDVVAPGTFILSTRSRHAQGEGYWARFDDDYWYFGGTSMACPLTAGACAILRQFLRQKRRRKPSAALVKAVLIHLAAHRPYRYAADDTAEVCDVEQGWGHVNLTPLVDSEQRPRLRFVDTVKGLTTGKRRRYRFTVTDESIPVKVTLVWSDYPGSPGRYPSVINNLNLMVTAPDGRDYHGNVFTPPYDATLDTVNNVEVVWIPDPLPGRYRITVVGMNVGSGPQPFALVWSAA